MVSQNASKLLLILIITYISIGNAHENSFQEISAKDIMDKIENGTAIQYDHVIINGDLNLSQLKLPKVYKKSFYASYLGVKEDLTASDLIKALGLQNATKFRLIDEFKIVKSPIRINHSIINGKMDASLIDFRNIVYFINTSFVKEACFEGAQFNGDVHFERAKFNEDAIFSDKYLGLADWVDIQFNKNAYFNDAEFKKEAKFNSVNFNRRAEFRGCKFIGEADFDLSKFNGYAYIESSSPYGTIRNAIGADFSFANFEKSVSFWEAEFIGLAQFHGADFNNTAKFEGTKFNRALTYFHDIKFKNIYIRFEDICDNFFYSDFSPDYVKNYKNIGWFEDVNNFYYYQRKAMRSAIPMSTLTWALDVIADVSYGYGYKLEFVLRNSMIIIIFFGFIFFRSTRKFVRSKPVSDQIAFYIKGRKVTFKNKIIVKIRYFKRYIVLFINRIILSVQVFLSGTKFFIDPPKIPKIKGGSDPWLGRWFILERALGAIFQGLFLLAITKTIINV
jgi:uncharacterized protein YjbI with pentapeptide repeats